MFERLRAIFGGRENLPVQASVGGGVGAGPGPIAPGALHAAVKSGDLAAVNDLIARGAELEARTPDGWTPLIEAVRQDVRIVTALLDAGANVNAATAMGYTALQRAAGQGRAEVVRLLLSRGADPGAVDDAGKSALDFAEDRGDSECVELLTQAGAPRRGGGDDGRDFDAEFVKFTEMLGMAHNLAGVGAASGVTQIAGGDGSSTAQAVTVRAPALPMGVAAEYEYLTRRFGPRQPTQRVASAGAAAPAPEPPALGWRMIQVACMAEGGRQFDRMEIIVAGGGSPQTIYFDITDFYSGGNPLPLLMAHAMSDKA